jgi:hypothetical protein
MKTVVCPNCSADTASIEDKPYCPRCGWNIPAAEQAVRISSLAYLILGSLLAILLTYGAMNHRQNRVLDVAAILAFAALIPIFYFLRSGPLERFKVLRRTLSMPPPAQTPGFKVRFHRETHSEPLSPTASSSPRTMRFNGEVHLMTLVTPSTVENPNPASAQFLLAQEQVSMIAAIPLPRRVRMTLRGKLYCLVLGPALVALEGLFLLGLWQDLSSGRSLWQLIRGDSGICLMAAFVFGVLIYFIRKITRDKHFLSQGETALGKVVDQRTSRDRLYRASSAITYIFPDKQMRVFQRKGTDYSKQYYEGMWIPIFYDPLDPSKNVAETCALYQLVTP